LFDAICRNKSNKSLFSYFGLVLKYCNFMSKNLGITFINNKWCIRLFYLTESNSVIYSIDHKIDLRTCFFRIALFIAPRADTIYHGEYVLSMRLQKQTQPTYDMGGIDSE
jgi:hypothetical protein